MPTGNYGRFVVFDEVGSGSQHIENSAGVFDITTTMPAIGPAVLEEAEIVTTSTVTRDPAWHFDIAVITCTALISGAVPIADITAEIPADAIITSVVRRTQINLTAVGSPGNEFSQGTVEARGVDNTEFATYVDTYSNIFVISAELVSSGTVTRGFLLSDPIRKWELAGVVLGYGWGYAGGAGLPDGIEGSLGATAFLAVDFTVTYTTPPPPPPPAQSGISPGSGTTGGGTTIAITGTDFVATPTVTFGGTPAAFVTFNSSTSLTVVTPAHAAGTVNVVVTNPDTQICTLPLAFEYVAPPPDVVACDQVVLELVYDAAILMAAVAPGSDTWPPVGSGGVSIPRGPGECAGVAYGIGVLGSPGGTAGTGDPMSTVAIDLKQFFGGASNAPPALGFLRAYAAGGTTPLDTFANSSLATANAWPIQLDADGNSPVPIFLGPFIYKFDLQTAAGASLPGFPKDNIAGSVWPGQVLGAVTVNPIANADGIGHSLSATLNKAASGTHALFALLKLLAPTIGAGSATLTESTTFYVAGPPLGGTTRYAVHVASGDVLLTDNASKLGFYGHAVAAQQLLATGAGHTVDDVITALQALGLVKQS